MLSTVRSSLSESAVEEVPGAAGEDEAQPEQFVYSEDAYMEEQHWEPDANDVVFDDHGEGVGIEGDLDVDDD